MPLQLKHFATSDDGNQRFGEATFASDDSDEPDEYLVFRAQIRSEKYPRLPEAQLEALCIVRNAIGDEIHRREQIRSRVHPNEDWRD